MTFKLKIITIDDGEMNKSFNDHNEVLNYISDHTDPELIGMMSLTTPDGRELKGYYTIAETLMKKY